MKRDYLIDELSVFLPAYNEEANLKSTASKVISVLQQTAQVWELIIINDGSKDKTGDIAQSIQSEYPQNVKMVTHNPNRGYGAAFKSGLYNASLKWIAFTDADGQFDFSEIDQFIKTQQQTKADLVIGYYISRQVTPWVIFTSKIWEIIVRILFGLHVKDIDCGFKLISKTVVDTIPPLEAERGAFISSEFLIKSKKAGFKITEIPVHHYPRQAGKATGRALKVIVKSFIDLFSLWFKINFAG